MSRSQPPETTPRPPSPRPARRGLRLAGAAVVALTIVALGVHRWKRTPRHHAARPNERFECVIDEREARATFDRIVPALRTSDCSVAGVETQFERIFVNLRSGTTLFPAVVVSHRGCGGAPIDGSRLAIDVQPATLARCPRAVASLRSALGQADGH